MLLPKVVTVGLSGIVATVISTLTHHQLANDRLCLSVSVATANLDKMRRGHVAKPIMHARMCQFEITTKTKVQFFNKILNVESVSCR